MTPTRHDTDPGIHPEEGGSAAIDSIVGAGVRSAQALVDDLAANGWAVVRRGPCSNCDHVHADACHERLDTHHNCVCPRWFPR